MSGFNEEALVLLQHSAILALQGGEWGERGGEAEMTLSHGELLCVCVGVCAHARLWVCEWKIAAVYAWQRHLFFQMF